MSVRKERTDGAKRKIILTRDTAIVDFEEWKMDPKTDLDREPVPKDYLKILSIKDQLFGDMIRGQITEPKPSEYMKYNLAASSSTGRESVEDEDAYRKAAQKWILVEGVIRSIIHPMLSSELRRVFESKENVYDGWKALLEELGYEKGNRITTLEQELMDFAQEMNETNVSAADRLQSIILQLRSVGVPDITKPDIVVAFELKIAEKAQLVSMAAKGKISEVQRRRVPLANNQRALVAQQKGMMKSPGKMREKPLTLTPEADPRAIFIGILPYSTSEQQLKSALSRFGDTEETSIPARKGFGFATFKSISSAKAAVSAEQLEIGGRQCFISPSNGKKRGGSGKAAMATSKVLLDYEEQLPSGFALSVQARSDLTAEGEDIYSNDDYIPCENEGDINGVKFSAYPSVSISELAMQLHDDHLVSMKNDRCSWDG
ncbi:hypothetical protein HDU67_001107 [Dinochytrium kinnereticum]|nr:hypothetical protein HDU67_001107 [Dinochytrium kinnereticum]